MKQEVQKYIPNKIIPIHKRDLTDPETLKVFVDHTVHNYKINNPN